MTVSASRMSPGALAALIGFYAESGVGDVCEDTAIDRFAQSRDLAQSRQERRAQSRQQREAQSRQQGKAQTAASQAPRRGGSAGLQRPDSRTVEAARETPQASQLKIPGEEAFGDARSKAASAGSIEDLRKALDGFTGCNLRHSAKSLVFADGNPNADIMFVGEAPGRDEDLQGLPFVGRAGKLLDLMLAAIGHDRTTAYITNMIPWRPPGNRTPAPHEIELCRPFIERHIALAAPKIVVMLGNVATKSLLNTNKGILSLRGGWMTYKSGALEIPAMPTLHPAYLLRNPAQKRLVWADLLALHNRLEQIDNKVQTTD